MNKYMLGYILLSTVVVSLISLIGVFFFSKVIERHLFLLVSFATGALLGTTFFDLLKETEQTSIVLVGILASFLLEKIFWHHHHHYEDHHKKHVHPAAYINLAGDGIHNFIDGTIIASSYLTSFPLGLTVTIAIILHEIPQELSDFAILLSSGFSVKRAIFFNFLSAIAAIAGALLVYFFSLRIEALSSTLIAFAAGGFLYIASVDMMPELHKERKLKKSIEQFIFILLGIGIIWLSTLYAGV